MHMHTRIWVTNIKMYICSLFAHTHARTQMNTLLHLQGPSAMRQACCLETKRSPQQQRSHKPGVTSVPVWWPQPALEPCLLGACKWRTPYGCSGKDSWQWIHLEAQWSLFLMLLYHQITAQNARDFSLPVNESLICCGFFFVTYSTGDKSKISSGNQDWMVYIILCMKKKLHKKMPVQ